MASLVQGCVVCGRPELWVVVEGLGAAPDPRRIRCRLVGRLHGLRGEEFCLLEDQLDRCFFFVRRVVVAGEEAADL